MGLSHFRSLLWKPWPQLELQSDHSDQVDHPPLTVVKDKVGVHFSPGKKYIGIWYYYIGIFLFAEVLLFLVCSTFDLCYTLSNLQYEKMQKILAKTSSQKDWRFALFHLIASKLPSVFWPFCQQFSRDLIIKAQSPRNNTVNLLCQKIFAIKVMSCLADSCS